MKRTSHFFFLACCVIGVAAAQQFSRFSPEAQKRARDISV